MNTSSDLGSGESFSLWRLSSSSLLAIIWTKWPSLLTQICVVRLNYLAKFNWNFRLGNDTRNSSLQRWECFRSAYRSRHFCLFKNWSYWDVAMPAQVFPDIFCNMLCHINMKLAIFDKCQDTLRFITIGFIVAPIASYIKVHFSNSVAKYSTVGSTTCVSQKILSSEHLWFVMRVWDFQGFTNVLPQVTYTFNYRQISNIRRTKSQNLNVSRLVLQLSLYSRLKPGVRSRMKM